MDEVVAILGSIKYGGLPYQAALKQKLLGNDVYLVKPKSNVYQIGIFNVKKSMRDIGEVVDQAILYFNFDKYLGTAASFLEDVDEIMISGKRKIRFAQGTEGKQRDYVIEELKRRGINVRVDNSCPIMMPGFEQNR